MRAVHGRHRGARRTFTKMTAAVRADLASRWRAIKAIIEGIRTEGAGDEEEEDDDEEDEDEGGAPDERDERDEDDGAAPPAPAAHPDARANATPAAPPGAGAASVAASDGHENDEDDGAPDERNERDEVRRRCRWWDPRCTRGCAHCKKKADGVTCKANCPFAPTSCTHLGNDVFVVYQRGAGDEFTDP